MLAITAMGNNVRFHYNNSSKRPHLNGEAFIFAAALPSTLYHCTDPRLDQLQTLIKKFETIEWSMQPGFGWIKPKLQTLGQFGSETSRFQPHLTHDELVNNPNTTVIATASYNSRYKANVLFIELGVSDDLFDDLVSMLRDVYLANNLTYQFSIDLPFSLNETMPEYPLIQEIEDGAEVFLRDFSISFGKLPLNLDSQRESQENALKDWALRVKHDDLWWTRASRQ